MAKATSFFLPVVLLQATVTLYCLNVHSTPLNLTTFSILNISSPSDLLPNLTALTAYASSKYIPTLLFSNPYQNNFRCRTGWPQTPFTTWDVTVPSSTKWLHFRWTGDNFTEDQATIVGWDIGSLIAKLDELDPIESCPKYYVANIETYLFLDIAPIPPTVTTCLKVLKTFEQLMDKYGAVPVVFEFGVGHLPVAQGAVKIGLKSSDDEAVVATS